MGYIKHHAIIVTSSFRKDIENAHQIAVSVFKEIEFVMYENPEKLVTGIYEGIANSQYTFCIVPDGSKEGWNASIECDNARNKFLSWMHGNDTGCDYVEILFGGDDTFCDITKKS